MTKRSAQLELLRQYLEVGEYTFDFAVVFLGVSIWPLLAVLT